MLEADITSNGARKLEETVKKLDLVRRDFLFNAIKSNLREFYANNMCHYSLVIHMYNVRRSILI